MVCFRKVERHKGQWRWRLHGLLSRLYQRKEDAAQASSRNASMRS